MEEYIYEMENHNLWIRSDERFRKEGMTHVQDLRTVN